MQSGWLIVILAILAYIVSVAGAVGALASDNKGISILVMWIFGGLSLVLLVGAPTVSIIIGVISFIVAIIAGFVAIVNKEAVGILIALSFLGAALYLLEMTNYLTQFAA